MKKAFFLISFLFIFTVPLYGENFVLKERAWKTLYNNEVSKKTEQPVPLALDEIKKGNVLLYDKKLVSVEGYVVFEADKSFRISPDTNAINTGCTPCARNRMRMRPRIFAPPEAVSQLKNGLVRVTGTASASPAAKAPEPALSLVADKIEIPV